MLYRSQSLRRVPGCKDHVERARKNQQPVDQFSFVTSDQVGVLPVVVTFRHHPESLEM